VNRGQPDDVAVLVRNDEPVRVTRGEPRYPSRHRIRLSGIAELPEQTCDDRRVVRPGIADRQAIVQVSPEWSSAVSSPVPDFSVAASICPCSNSS
jgi:hypothetical protein